MAENTDTNYSGSISREDSASILESFSEFPLAIPLVEIFKTETAPTSYRLVKCRSLKIYGRPIEEGIDATLMLSRIDNHISLDILDVKIELLHDEMDNLSHYAFACINAGPRNTGVWGYGLGNRISNSLTIDLSNGWGSRILLPSKNAKWFFDLMSRLVVLSGEHCQNVSDQPSFYDGQGER